LPICIGEKEVEKEGISQREEKKGEPVFLFSRVKKKTIERIKSPRARGRD